MRPGSAWCASRWRASMPSVPPLKGPSRRTTSPRQASLSPEQRAEMVRGMVERLAERLKQDGSDVEGWLRLVRAYMVLGDTRQGARTPPATRAGRWPASRTSCAASTSWSKVSGSKG